MNFLFKIYTNTSKLSFLKGASGFETDRIVSEIDLSYNFTTISKFNQVKIVQVLEGLIRVPVSGVGKLFLFRV